MPLFYNTCPVCGEQTLHPVNWVCVNEKCGYDHNTGDSRSAERRFRENGGERKVKLPKKRPGEPTDW